MQFNYEAVKLAKKRACKGTNYSTISVRKNTLKGACTITAKGIAHVLLAIRVPHFFAGTIRSLVLVTEFCQRWSTL